MALCLPGHFAPLCSNLTPSPLGCNVLRFIGPLFRLSGARPIFFGFAACPKSASVVGHRTYSLVG
jgi:hypothetical protein